MDRFSLSRSNLTFVILALSILCNTSSVYGSEGNKLEEAAGGGSLQQKVLVKANDAPLPKKIQGKFFVRLVLFVVYNCCVF